MNFFKMIRDSNEKCSMFHARCSKVLEFGLYALVFSLPWQTKLILRQSELNRGDWQYGTIALFGTDILLVVLLGLFLILSWRKKNNGQSGTAFWPSSAAEKVIVIILSILDLSAFLSIFFAPDTTLAIYHYGLFLLGLGLFWLIVKTEFSWPKLAVAFFSGLVIQSVLAVGQFLEQGAFACKWLGLAAHSPADLGDSVVETFGADGVPERWLRAYGSLDHPNILGGLLAIGLLVFVWIFINRKRAEGEKGDWRNIVYDLSFVLISAGLVFTFCRSAALALLAGSLIFLISIIRGRNWPALKRLALTALLGAAVLGMIFISYRDLFITRAESSTRLEVKSFSERQMYQDDSFGLIRKDWLFGSGIGNYTKALSLTDPQRPWYYLNPVHNVFLLVFSEIGIFGLLSFIVLLGCLFALAWRKSDFLCLSILAALVIIMMFDHYLWSLHFGILFFWLAMGIIYKRLR